MNYNSSQVQREEMSVIKEFVGMFTNSKTQELNSQNVDAGRILVDLPYSFDIGGNSSRDWLELKNASCNSGTWKDGQRVHILSWNNSETSLCCTMELTEFSDYPTVEWVIRICNNGETETELISNFKAIDILWETREEGQIPELRRSLGSDARHDDYQYICDELRQSLWDPARTIRMDFDTNSAFRNVRNGSASFIKTDVRCSATWLPFFNLRTGNDGIICALGWSGGWFAEFAHDGTGKTKVMGGMDHLKLKLMPGKEIRSARVLLQYWIGTPIHSHNVFRQFVLKYHTPQSKNSPVEMPICNGSWGGTPTSGHLKAIKKISELDLPYDYYWIDAGWYGTSSEPCPDVFHGDWATTGDWRVNRNYHPDGLKPISDAVHKAGMKFLLWIEPLRAKHGTPVTIEHPEWFLRIKKEESKPDDNLLLNLGHPKAWEWAVETVSSLITENDIDCYREDFNIDPYLYWENEDEEGRRGLVEMCFTEGLYAFWDELNKRHPNLIIDNCASGGRRLDLETISRSVPLWRTDYNCFPSIKADASQLHGMGLNLWLPMNSTSPMAKPGDTYQVRSAYSSGIVLSIDEFGLKNSSSCEDSWDWLRQRLNEAKRLRPYFLGDYYPLTPINIEPNSWAVYQLHLSEKQEGVVIAFRRPECCMASAAFQLYGLSESETYEIEDVDSRELIKKTGNDLMTNGLQITTDMPRTSRIMFYHV
jgi:alpha-galactosidase